MADIVVIDGEDAGSTPWEFDSLVEEGGNAIALSAASAIHGSNGYEITYAGTDIDVHGVKDFAEEADTYLRFYINFKSWVAANNTETTWRVLKDGTTTLCYFQPRYLTAVPSFGYALQIIHNGGVAAVINKVATDIFQIDQEYYLELRYKSGGIGTGGYEFWIDGVSEGSDFATYDTSDYGANRIEIGTTAGTVPGNGSVVYVDDIKVATGPIGAYPVARRGERFVRGGLIERKWFKLVKK